MSLGRVVIVGLGLMGGSLAKALRERSAAEAICAVDYEATLSAASGYVDESAAPGSSEANGLLGSADLVVLAAPGRIVLDSIAPALDALRPQAALTDTASFKLAVVERAETHPRRARFVPGHPMAGREVGGFEASRADLFANANWFLVESGADADALERIRHLVLAVGARPRIIDADEHDRAMAIVSHLPHLVASALVELAADADVLDFAGPGFKDTTRIAGGPDAIWADIFANNRDAILTALDAFTQRLDEMKSAFASGEQEGVREALRLLASARRVRDNVGGS